MQRLQPPPADAPALGAPDRSNGAPRAAAASAPGSARESGAGGRERPRVRFRMGRRLLIALLLAGVLPVAIAGYLTGQEQARVLRQEALDRAQQVAELLAARVHLFVRGPQDDLAVLANTPELRAAILHGNWTDVQRILGIAASHHPDLRATLLADASGTARAATGVAEGLLGQDVSARPRFALARTHRKLVVSDPFLSPLDRRPVIGLAVPILDGDRIAGILGAAVDLNLLAADLQRVHLGAGGVAVVQTAEGRVIVHPDPSRVLQMALEANRAPTLTRRGPTGSLETTRPDGTRDLTGFATVPDLNWVVLAHIPREQALASLAASRQHTLTLLGWLLAMVGVLALVYGRVLARPMNHLAEVARALGAGDLSRRVSADRGDEIGEVARAFNEMADRRQQAEAALQTSLAQCDVLAQLSGAIAAAGDRAEIAHEVVTATARLLGAPYAVLWTLDPDGRHMTTAAEFVDPALGPLPPQPPIPADRTLAGRSVREQAPVSVPDVRSDPQWTNQAWLSMGPLGAYLGLPFFKDGAPISILQAMDRPGRSFTDDEIELLRSLGTHAILALEKATLLEATRQAAAQAQVLFEAGKLVTETVEMDTVLARIVEKAADLLQASACGVALIEGGDHEEGIVLRFIHARGLKPDYRQAIAFRPGEAVVGRAFEELRPIWTADILNDHDIWLTEGTRQRILADEIPRAILATPLVRGKTVIGTLVVYRPAGATYTPAEVQVLSALASQAAIAIENARLYARTHEAYDELAAIHTATQAIAQSLDVQETLRRILRAAMQLTETDKATLWLLDEERQELVGTCLVGEGQMEELSFPLAEPCFGAACLREGRTLMSSDPQDDPRCSPRLQARFGTKALIAIPLRLRQQVVGVLDLADLKRIRRFTPREIASLERLGQQAVVALENARLFQSAKQTAEEIEALYEAGQAITESLDLHATLGRIAETARRLAGADRTFVWLVDPQDGSLEAGVALGPGAETFPGTRLPADSPATSARAVREGRPIALSNALDPAAADPALSARLGNAALLTVPLRFRETIHGALACGYNHPRTFDSADVNRLASLAQQAAIAVQNARLFQQEQDRRQQVEAVRAVAVEITRELDLTTLLDLLTRRAVELLGAGSGAIYLWDEAAECLLPHAWHGRGDWMHGVRFRLGEGFTGTIAQRRQGMIVNDAQGFPFASPLFQQRPGVTARLGEPLLYRGRLLGVLTVDDHGVGRPFTALDRETLALFASQAAIAIENARLYREAADRATRLSIVNEIGRAVVSALDLDAVFQAIVHQVQRAIPCVRASLAVPAADDRQYRVSALWPADMATTVGAGTMLPVGEGPVDEALRSRRIVPVRDTRQLADRVGQRLAEEGILSSVHVPICAGEVTLGVLNLGEDRPDAFTPEHVALLESLAPHLATALQNAAIFAEAERRRRVAEAVNRVTKMVTAALDLGTVTNAIAGAVVELLETPLIRLYIPDPIRGGLSLAASAGEAELLHYDASQGGHVAPLATAALQTGTPQYACPVAEDPRYIDTEWARLHGLQMFLAIPLWAADEKVGVFTIQRREARPLSDEEMQTLSTFADQAAIAIQNARLYQQEQVRRQQVEAVRCIAEEINRELELPTLLQLIQRRAAELVGATSGAIRLWNEGTQSLVAQVWWGLGDWVREVTYGLGEGITGLVAQQRKGMIVNDYRSSPHANPNMLERTEITAVLSEPLLYRDRLVGVISVNHEDGARRFTEQDRETLALFAAQAAIAIENARLFQEATRRAEELEAIHRVNVVGGQTLDLEDILQRSLEEIIRTTGAASGWIYLENGELAERGVQVGNLPRQKGDAGLAAWAGGSSGACGALGDAPLVRCDCVTDLEAKLDHGARNVSACKQLARGHAGGGGIRGHASVLLRVEGRPIGVLNLAKGDFGPYRPEELAILERLAAPLALAVERAGLHRRLQRHAEQLEDRVRERTAELEKANRAKSEFLANMSHELRTPLNAIIGFADLLHMQGVGPLTPKQQKYVTNIQTGGVHLLNLVNDVLDLARVESGRMVLRRERTPVVPAIAEVLEGCRPQAEKKGVALACEAEPDLPPIYVDPVRLRQILGNLLSNAVKFTPEGGRVTVRAGRVGGESPATDSVEIAVQDTGIGIAPEDLGRLFRKFEQLQGGMAKPHQGTGLGLALTRQLVELHGGTIAVHSAGRGQGSMLTVRLPIGPRRERPLVLTVDDDPLIRELLAGCLHEWGCEGVAAGTLAEARTAIEREQPDLIILDASMPDGSGTGFAREVRRALAPRVPILMYTGLGAEEGRAAVAAGADDFLVKPAPPEAIRRKATELLARAGWPELPGAPGRPAAEEAAEAVDLPSAPGQGS